jgi:surface protein
MTRLRFATILSVCIVLGLSFGPIGLQAQDAPFVTVWDTENQGQSGDSQIIIPGTGTDYTIEWEEVGNTSNNGIETGTDEHTVTFPEPGVYRVEIGTGLTRVNFGQYTGTFSSEGDPEKIVRIEQWGDIEWSTMEEAFRGCTNLDLFADDGPDLSGVTTLSRIFSGATSLDAADSSIGSWDVSSITDMSFMFQEASSFNQDIGGWNVANVTNMSLMFQGASSFNQDISGWQTENVTRMISMFEDAKSFDQDIGNWSTGSVENMRSMFAGASSFNQNLGRWDVTNVEDFPANSGMSGMLYGTDISSVNYDRTIIGWSNQDLQSGISLTVGGTYCNIDPFIIHLQRAFNWTIVDNGRKEGCPDILTASERAKEIGGDGTFDFEDVATSVSFSGLIGQGKVTIARYENSPQSIGGISERNVSDFRLIIAESNISTFESAQLRFDVDRFDGIASGADITVYRRRIPNHGTFSALSTVFDEQSGELIADTDGFGEIVFASNGELVPYPETIMPTISRSFGDASGPADYRLVALPGQVDLPLSASVNGGQGEEWQAYWDTGSESDFLVKHDGSDAFNFTPGRGFWLTSRQDWTFEESVETVPLEGNQETKIPLHEGWNIISNPFERSVSLGALAQANGENPGPLWAFDGSFTRADTFRSAASGQAYYLLNFRADSLIVPYSPSGPTPSLSSVQGRETGTESFAIRAEATVAGDTVKSTVRLGTAEGAKPSVDSGDVIAPTTHFSKLSLRSHLSSEDKQVETYLRGASLATDLRPGQQENHEYQLRLRASPGTRVTLRASGVEKLGRQVVLLDPKNARSYDLRPNETIGIEMTDSTRTLRTLLGSEAFVDRGTEKAKPDKITLSSYPNPLRDKATIEYTLSEETYVQIVLHDVLGRQVAILEKGRKQAGRHTLRLNAKRLSGGVYFGRLTAGDQTRTQKITIVH